MTDNSGFSLLRNSALAIDKIGAKIIAHESQSSEAELLIIEISGKEFYLCDVKSRSLISLFVEIGFEENAAKDECCRLSNNLNKNSYQAKFSFDSEDMKLRAMVSLPYEYVETEMYEFLMADGLRSLVEHLSLVQDEDDELLISETW